MFNSVILKRIKNMKTTSNKNNNHLGDEPATDGGYYL